MKVIFRNNWFAPSPVEVLDKIRTRAGRMFRKASEPQHVPDNLFPYLPKSAKVIEPPVNVPKMPDKKPVEPVASGKVESRVEHDMERAAAEAMPDDAPPKRGPGRPPKAAE
ncbi:MAG: hypothetical protein VW338_09180 [Rhodospirillaceae bacterium]